MRTIRAPLPAAYVLTALQVMHLLCFPFTFMSYAERHKDGALTDFAGTRGDLRIVQDADTVW